MIATVLMDNTATTNQLVSEHGLSIWFEADGHTWLMDVGASDKFGKNARQLGIDLTSVDFLILSHGHADHTGGLKYFLEVNHKARVILSKHLVGKTLFSSRQSARRNITMDLSLIDQYSDRFILADGNVQLTQKVALIGDFPGLFAKPRANARLTISDGVNVSPDGFQHELCMALKTDHGLVVFSGCSHNGLLNILEAATRFCQQSEVAACIGGTHLIDGGLTEGFESDLEIRQIGQSLNSLYPGMQLHTGHCTGHHAGMILGEVMGSRLSVFQCGTRIEL